MSEESRPGGTPPTDEQVAQYGKFANGQVVNYPTREQPPTDWQESEQAAQDPQQQGEQQ